MRKKSRERHDEASKDKRVNTDKTKKTMSLTANKQDDCEAKTLTGLLLGSLLNLFDLRNVVDLGLLPQETFLTCLA
jgi:hypothetical protein